MLTAQIEKAVAAHVQDLKPGYSAFYAYTKVYYDALQQDQPTPEQLAEVDRYADEWDRLRPDTMRHCAEAVASMKTAGLWTDDLDSLINQRITDTLTGAGVAADEVARLQRYLTADTTCRANIETAIATELAVPRLTDPGGGKAMATSSIQDTCLNWWMNMWVAGMFCIFILECFIVVFIGLTIVTLACAGHF